MADISKINVNNVTYDIKDTKALKSKDAAINPAVLSSGAVRYDEEQSLTDNQKLQARSNIAAIGSTGTALSTTLPVNADTLDEHAASYFATKDTATTSEDGLMSSTDKTKLDTIEANAQVNVTNGITINGVDVPIDQSTKKQNIPIAQEEVLGVIKPRAVYGTQIVNNYLAGATRLYSQYEAGSMGLILCKGTIEELFKARGICQAIKDTMDSVAVANAQYYLGEQSSVSFSLPSNVTHGQSVSVVFYSGTTPTTLSISGTTIGTIPTPQANTRYEINCLYDGSYWSILSNSMAVE